MEYVEFVVVDTSAFYDCGVTSPPCIDIRGWIFDDNSGYHGTGGVAAGANRFSNDPLWSCVELGTIILIYNDADPNPEVPSDDLSTSDGNCVVIAPISNTTLFETNTTTPGAVACSYPTTGWIAGGDWSSTLLANGGDCARLVDTAGCEVFSVCWGSNNLNTQIYFSGGATSPTSASNTVYYFNDGEPTDQVNWSIGCADVPACGLEEQTPGAANNTANADYIGQFNNYCSPITPVAASATGTDDCGCNGSATASGSGSIPSYTFEWTDATFTPIGQTTATASGLCSGNYNVIVTSSIGCSDTASITISNVAAPSAGTGTSINLCDTDPSIDLLDSLSGSPDITGVWQGPSTLTGGSNGTFDPSTNSAGQYDYIVGSGTSCADTASISISLESIPAYNSGADTICSGDSALFFVSGSTSTTWSNGFTTDSIFLDSSATFTVQATNGCGTFTFSDSLHVEVFPTVTISTSGLDSICPGDTIQLLASSNTGSFVWTDLSTANPFIISTPGTYFAATSNFCGAISSDSLIVSLVSCSIPEEPIIDVIIPNIFTPNGDDYNDQFHLVSYINVVDVTGYIYNRWGQVLYIWNGLDDAWDGRTMSGEKTPDGTYYYTFEFTDINDETFSRKGFFMKNE